MSKIIVIILLHILGDSILLSKKLRKQKIEKIAYLFLHVGIYSLVLLVVSKLFLKLTIIQSLEFTLLNAVLHFAVDYVMTKIKLIYWTNNHYKYVAILSAFEHILHISLLIVTFVYMFPSEIDFSNWFNVVRYFFFDKPV